MPQWVIWRYIRRNGRRTKLPINPHTGRSASSTNPRTWGTYTEAQRAAERFGAAGLGFVFTADDVFVGIDLDGCRDVETGEVEGWAQDIIEKLDSFTEVSPSGRGVHVIVKAEKPRGRCRVGSVEMYDSGRFFCVTGQHVTSTPEYVELRQDAVDALFADAFVVDEPEVPERGRRRRHEPIEPEYASESGIDGVRLAVRIVPFDQFT